MSEEYEFYRVLRISSAELLYCLIAIRAAVERGDTQSIKNELLVATTNLDLIIDRVEKLKGPG